MQRDRSLNILLATVFRLGEAPCAPGTVATLAAGVPCFLAVGCLSWPIQFLFAALVFGIGRHVSGKTAEELEKTDPGEVVIDELCGYLVAMLGHPVSLASILAGFLLFRLFDIWKPWPLRNLENELRGGTGIMMDDVGAGIYANITGLIILKLVNAW